VAEVKMEKANRLSQRADWKVEVDKDNDNQIFIKDNWIHSMYEVVVEGPECYDSMLKALSKELTLVLSNTRELDRVPKTK